MIRIWLRALAGVCALAAVVTMAQAQDEVKEKPPMYSYVSFWTIPRAQWGEMDKADAADQKLLEKAMSDGGIVGYGSDVDMVHQPDWPTHDSWWSAMSMAGVLNMLDTFYKSGTATTSVLESATRHADGIYVSRFYNWRPGTYKGAYTRVAYYKLKKDAPNDAVEMLSKTVVVPVLDKLVADGTLIEYEVDEEAIHTESPDAFWIDVISTNAEGLDKMTAALREAGKTNPLRGPAIESMVESSEHRDFLSRTTATYK